MVSGGGGGGEMAPSTYKSYLECYAFIHFMCGGD